MNNSVPVKLPNKASRQLTLSAQKETEVSTSFNEKLLPNVWIYDGEAYDLTDFIKQHPGGEFFVRRTKNRDITTFVNFFHNNPEKVKRVLKKYSLGRSAQPEDIHPTCWAPNFLFPRNFDSGKDTPQYNFQREGQLLDRIRGRLNQPEMRAKIANMDFLFDLISIFLSVAYVLVDWLRLSHQEYLPIYIFIPVMAILKIALSGTGHYLLHRSQTGLNRIFANVFDINYVPLAMVQIDGHNLMHHPFIESKVDVKKNGTVSFFLELPRYYRVPLHTLHTIAHIISGMFAQIIIVGILAIQGKKIEAQTASKDVNVWPLSFPVENFIGALGIHILLLGEMILFAVNGDILAWLGQFLLTLWLTTFLVLASHEFHEQTTQEEINWTAKDWAQLQIENSRDITMIGNKYIDSFLSAGLGPHRVHHVLPQQKSAFANLVSEDIVREEAEKFNVTWLPAQNFFFDLLPKLVNQYLLATPSQIAKENHFGLFKEHFHPQALKVTVQYLISGFTGFSGIG